MPHAIVTLIVETLIAVIKTQDTRRNSRRVELPTIPDDVEAVQTSSQSTSIHSVTDTIKRAPGDIARRLHAENRRVSIEGGQSLHDSEKDSTTGAVFEADSDEEQFPPPPSPPLPPPPVAAALPSMPSPDAR